MLRGADEHGAKKRSFAFALVYIKCFRAYSVYLSLRHGVFILYTPCHLPPQREARALPRRAPKLTASERKIVTKETHQGCVFYSRRLCLAKARRKRSRAVRRISLDEHKEPRLVRIFAPCGYFHENLYKKQPAAFRKSTKRKQRAVRSWIFGENALHDSAKDADFSPTYG